VRRAIARARNYALQDLLIGSESTHWSRGLAPSVIAEHSAAYRGLSGGLLNASGGWDEDDPQGIVKWGAIVSATSIPFTVLVQAGT